MTKAQIHIAKKGKRTNEILYINEYRLELNVTKALIDAKRVNSAKFEAYFMTFATIITTRNGIEGSNYHIRNTMMPLLKCLATGCFAQWLVTAQRCSPNLGLGFQFLQYKACYIASTA